MIQEYFGLELGSVHLALPLVDLETVAKFEQKGICTIPGIASFWYGVFNYRGSLLWVLDTEQFLGLTAEKERSVGRMSADSADQKLTAVVLSHQFQGSKRRVALVVRQLEGILSINQSQLESVSSLSSSFSIYCTTKIEQDNKTFYVLDSETFLEQLYTSSELSISV